MNARSIIGFSVVIMVLLLASLTLLRQFASSDKAAESLTLYCAAGIKGPVKDTIADYEEYYKKNHGRSLRVEVEYAGSGTLLNRLQVSQDADLYLAGDASFVQKAREDGVVKESLELAEIAPVIALSEELAGDVNSLHDLLEGDYRIAIGVPDGTAVGSSTRAALKRIGEWQEFQQSVDVTRATVNKLGNDVKLGAVDAAIVFDMIARQFNLEYVRDDALEAESGVVEIGVLSSTEQPTAALKFARFLAAPQRGQKRFEEHHFDAIEGDKWEEKPEVTFFSGGVNRRALEPIIERFQRREGVRVNTVIQGCGALNAQMSTINKQDPEHGFPDAYLACDVYYLDPVDDWFEQEATVSSTRIVIVTQKGNPHDIHGLEDLTQEGLRIVVGHPTHCTIGGLTERLFKAKGLYDEIMENVVEKQPSSGMMVPPITSGAADASLAYYTDTLAEKDKLHTVELDSEYAQAVQPFAIASTSDYKNLMLRLFRKIGRSREIYEELGFGWKFGRSPDDFEVVAPEGARPPRNRGEEQD